MSEAWLLSLVARYPHATALARRVRDGSVIGALRQLEARGLVRCARGSYLLTARGRDELAMTRMLARLAGRTRATAPSPAG